jgi:hypothetical protein
MAYPVKTIFNILHQDLGLEKKSARWAPKLQSYDNKQERIPISLDFVVAVHH